VQGHGRRRPPFEDRRDAAARLAAAVALALGGATDRYPSPVVLGLPRGGVVLAAEVALTVGAPLDVLVVRKLGHPRRPELGIGAIAEDGVRVLNDDLVARLRVTAEELDAVTASERAELARRVALYRGGPRPALAGGTAVIVDDGLATGYTALAALQSARKRGAVRALLAVPVGAREAVALLGPAVDELICLVVPGAFGSVGQAYHRFGQVPDEEVVAALARCRRART
jgi:putative phosphoribosyl transferase